MLGDLGFALRPVVVGAVAPSDAGPAFAANPSGVPGCAAPTPFATAAEAFGRHGTGRAVLPRMH
jgi:hypothetical protein